MNENELTKVEQKQIKLGTIKSWRDILKGTLAMDEADIQQKARAFVASVDTSNIQNDLSAYVQRANAKLKKEELGKTSQASPSLIPYCLCLVTAA